MMKYKHNFLRLMTLGFLLSLVFACNEEDVKPIAEPKATFSSEINPDNPLKVSFSSSLTNAVSITWDFGDGETITKEINPTHTYVSGGDHTVTLTVAGEEGSTPAIASSVITLEKVFVPLVIENGDFSLPGDGKHGNWNEVPGWNSDTEATDSGVEGSGDSWTAFLKTSDPSAFNLTDHTITNGEEFKVNMDVWDIWNAPKFSITFYYDSGDGTRNVLAAKTFDIVASQNNAIEFSAVATGAADGAKLGIEFDNESSDGGDGWSGFDTVQLMVK